MGIFRSSLAMAMGIGILVGLTILELRARDLLEPAELAAYDFFLKWRPPSLPNHQRIILIGVTEEDIRRWGWPLADAIVAEVLERLRDKQPRAIGLDIYRDRPVLTGYERLATLLSGDERIIAVMKFGDKNNPAGVAPPPVLQGSTRVGFSDVPEEPGGVVRRGLLFLDDGHTVAYSLPLRLALKYLQKEHIAPQPGTPNPHHLRLGRVTLPPFEADDGGYVEADAGGYQLLLDFAAGPRGFPSYSLTEVLTGTIPPAAVEDKIVLIGAMADSVKDYFYTPLSRDQPMPGVALQAHITHQLLRSALEGTPPIQVISDAQEAAWIGLWTVLGALLGLRIHSSWQFSAFVISGLAVLGLGCYGALLYRWWLPFMPPALGGLISASVVTSYVSGRQYAERTQLMQLFSKYLPKDVAETLWEQRERFLKDGRPRPQKLTATVLFSDLQGFTSVSEKLDPQTLMDWLNDYMQTMAAIVMAHGGLVDKFIGDAIMAIFGAPLKRTTTAGIQEDARHAVDCALAMQQALGDLNAQWQARGLPTVGVRIGIFTGPLVVGSLGNRERMEYTAIGDTVNIASRLESFRPEVAHNETPQNTACRILVGGSTRECLDEHYQAQYRGTVRLKGKQKEVTVYQIIAAPSQRVMEVMS